ncbi:hypothetical protein LCO01nite_09760 [Lapidilactobacillus concavus]|nr:glycoside hydrolase family 73 protein [Lapidilactobacillus concavus]GEL13427.1 hypothetical protein LCO01nite_09760 [Lapidilactobacillus concavus]
MAARRKSVRRKSPRRNRFTSGSNQQFYRGMTKLGFILAAIIVSVMLLFVMVEHQQTVIKAHREAVASSQAAVVNKKKAFIQEIAPEAVKLRNTYQVLPSVTIAQAILESNWGESQLTAKYRNLFGIKGSDPTNTREMTTQEYVNGQWQTVTARFRVYPSYAASLLEHAQLFHKGTTWNPQQYVHFLAADNYKAAAEALQTDGYATDPDYATKLINLIEQYDLNQYDK